MSRLPVIDLSSPDRSANARAITKAMKTVGFILLDNVTGFNESALQEVTEWLFNMPQERKLRLARKKWNKDSRNKYRGYFPVDVTAVSHKEGYEFGPEMASRDPYIQTAYPFCEPNVWPEQEDGEDEKFFIKFSETVKGHYVSLFNAAVEFTRLLALGLGLSENYFDQLYIPKTLSTFRLLHYPLRQDAIPATAVCDDGTVLCCDAHVDSGMFTLLTTFNNPGLQIRMKNGTWMPVESRTGTLIANMGKMMAEMSGDRIKAVEHRVAVTEPRERFSCAFFLEPGYNAHVPLSLPIGYKDETESQQTVPFFEYGPYLAERIKNFVEYADD